MQHQAGTDRAPTLHIPARGWCAAPGQLVRALQCLPWLDQAVSGSMHAHCPPLQLVREGGWGALFAGLEASLIGTTVSQGIYFYL